MEAAAARPNDAANAAADAIVRQRRTHRNLLTIAALTMLAIGLQVVIVQLEDYRDELLKDNDNASAKSSSGSRSSDGSDDALSAAVGERSSSINSGYPLSREHWLDTIRWVAAPPRHRLHVHRSIPGTGGNVPTAKQALWRVAQQSRLPADEHSNMESTHYHEDNASSSSSSSNYAFYLQRAAEEGQPEAQFYYANALSAGFITSHPQGGRYKGSDVLVADDWLPNDGNNDDDGIVAPLVAQETRAWIYWRMAAQQGNIEALLALGHRLDHLHQTSPAASTIAATANSNANSTAGFTCPEVLPYFKAAANLIVDELESGPTRAQVLPATDRHDLAQMHLHGFTSVKLEGHNKPDETAESLQFYHARSQDDSNKVLAAQAAHKLGTLYYYGNSGVAQNFTLAAEYLERAANRGHWESAGLAGKIHLWGMGDVAADPNHAHRLFGLGMPIGYPSCKRRVEEYKAQKEGSRNDVYLCNSDSLTGMAILRLLGVPMVVSIDRELAEEMLTLAKEQGHLDARYHLTMMKLGHWTHIQSLNDLHSAGGKGQSKPELPFAESTHHPSIQEYKNIVMDLLEASRHNHILATHRLALMYSTGVQIPHAKLGQQKVVTEDCDKALQYWHWMAQHANPILNARLRRAYGHYKDGQLSEALMEYMQAAETGHGPSQRNAAFLLGQGNCLGLPSSNGKFQNSGGLDCNKAAVRWYKAASHQHPASHVHVGDFYYYGRLASTGYSGGGGGGSSSSSHEDDSSAPRFLWPTSPGAWWMRIQHWILFPEQMVEQMPLLLAELWNQRNDDVVLPDGVNLDDDDDISISQGSCKTKEGGDDKESCSMDEYTGPSSEELSSRIRERQRAQQEQEWATAAQYYREATKKHSHHPRANFNLGFMHQWGLGVTQDFPLAKRHYDNAAASSQEAQVPVALALWALKWHQYLLVQFEHYSELWHDYQARKRKRIEEPASLSDIDRSRTKADVFVDHILSLESAIILLLSLLFSVLINMRRTRR